MHRQSININQCSEGTKISNQQVSHFYKLEDSLCTCVFCGQKLRNDPEYNDLASMSSLSEIGVRS